MRQTIKFLLLAILFISCFSLKPLSVEADELSYGYADGYSKWSTDESLASIPGVKILKQYRKQDATGYQTTAERVNDQSVRKQIYYIDIEYVIFKNNQWLGVGDPTAINNTPKTFKEGGSSSDLTTVIGTVESNKWGFYTAGRDAGSVGNVSAGSSNFSMKSSFTCYSSKCSRTASVYTNTVDLGSQPSINPYGDPVFFYGIAGVGMSASNIGYGWRAGLGGEYQEYNHSNSGACGWRGNTGNTQDRNSWCFINKVGNKTNTVGQAIGTTITDELGRSFEIYGRNGSSDIYACNRTFPEGDWTNGVSIYNISLLERTYYINETEESRGTVVCTTWVTPTWGPWSDWDLTVYEANTSRHVEERNLYSYPLEYTINFNSNGGTGSMSPFKASYIQATTLPESGFSKTGYHPNGWSLTAGGSAVVGEKGGATATALNAQPNGSVTVYQVWEPNQYTVSFNSGGGSDIADKVVTYDSAYGTLETPDRPGYTFDGWFTQAEGGSKVDAATIVKITDNQTLFAHWTIIVYKINWFNYGSARNVTEYTVEDDDIVFANSSDSASREFRGWMEDNDPDKVITGLPHGSTGDRNIYGRWSSTLYDITLLPVVEGDKVPNEGPVKDESYFHYEKHLTHDATCPVEP